MTVMNSFKQLFRKPAKAVIFFVLLTGATMLLVFGGAMYAQNTARMRVAESIFTTIATIEQPILSADYITQDDGSSWVELDYGDIITPEMLDFPGAEYIHKPENRATYLTYLPDKNPPYTPWINDTVAEFRVLEEAQGDVPAMIEVTKCLSDANTMNTQNPYDRSGIIEGDQMHFSFYGATPIELKKGKTYVGGLEIIGRDTLCPVISPYSTQHDKNGQLADSSRFTEDAQQGIPYIEEVTEDFYSPRGNGEAWLLLSKELDMIVNTYPVLAINSFDMLPSYRQARLRLNRGRMITQEELDSGAKVCMISNELAIKNLIYEGDKITLPLLAAMYGYDSKNGQYSYDFMRDCSLIDAEGRLYPEFWEAEYEVVGMFTQRYGAEEIKFSSMFILPQKSIEASDENCIAYYKPMSGHTGALQIPNGSVEEFSAALLETVPESRRLKLEYDDMGYARTIESLNQTRRTAFLLFAVGLLACVSIVALLMYFFVVRERRRTAIERSLGLTRRQCRASLMAALMSLSLVSVCLGSGLGALLMGNVDTFAQVTAPEEAMEDLETEVQGELGIIAYDDDPTYDSERWGMGGTYNFSAKYSLWAMWDAKDSLAALEEIEAPAAVYIASPLVLLALIFPAVWVLVGKSMKVEPILLLSVKA